MITSCRTERCVLLLTFSSYFFLAFKYLYLTLSVSSIDLCKKCLNYQLHHATHSYWLWKVRCIHFLLIIQNFQLLFLNFTQYSLFISYPHLNSLGKACDVNAHANMIRYTKSQRCTSQWGRDILFTSNDAIACCNSETTWECFCFRCLSSWFCED